VQGRPKAALPGDPFGSVELAQQLELLGEQIVVVGEIVAEQRKRLGEDATSDDELGPPAGDEVQGRKISNTLTGSAVLRMVTALAKRMRLVRAAMAASTTAVAETDMSSR
jgi:hypothetical protein